MSIRDKRIPIDQCVERKLYKLHARNIKIGVYVREPKHDGSGEWNYFYGIRTKFGSRFIDHENHWDGQSFASCCPLEEIGECPADIPIEYGSEALFKWLETKENELALSDETYEEWKLKLFQEELEERKRNRQTPPIHGNSNTEEK